jgi:hypothetical protein
MVSQFAELIQKINNTEPTRNGNPLLIARREYRKSSIWHRFNGTGTRGVRHLTQSFSNRISRWFEFSDCKPRSVISS